MHVYIVDDDPDLRKSIAIVLQRAGHTVQMFAHADAFVSVADDLPPGCILLDFCMPGLDGLEAQRVLLARNSPHRVILFTGVGEIPEAVRAMRAGAVDVLSKPYRRSELLDAIARAQAELDQLLSARNVSEDSRLATLSEKELAILAASAGGKSSKQVAFEEALSVRTIEMHRANVIRKLGVRNFAGALLIYAQTSHAQSAAMPLVRAEVLHSYGAYQ